MGGGLEERIRAAWDADQLAMAAELAIEGYGREVLGFLVTTLGSEQDASEVFSLLCEDLWRGLARFEWRCSMRTWLYVLARHARARHLRDPHRRAERNVPLSQISDVAERLRSRTLAHLRTEARDGLARLRNELTADERALLVLRVDRKLSWDDIATILEDEPDGDRKKATARLRKRFQLLKAKLRRLAEQAGLLASDEAGS